MERIATLAQSRRRAPAHKDTSGIMVVAASALALRALVDGIQQRLVQRSYVAICEGVMIGGQDVDQPIGRDPKHRTRQAVRDDGKPALSHVRVRTLSRSFHGGCTAGDWSHHQIRVHMQSIGFPWWAIVSTGGDELCLEAPMRKRLPFCINFRDGRCAAKLQFEHPIRTSQWPSVRPRPRTSCS